jgi:hypothetical protein
MSQVLATRVFVLSQWPESSVLTAEFCADVVHRFGYEEEESLCVMSNLFRILTRVRVQDVESLLLKVMYMNCPSVELHSQALAALAFQFDNRNEALVECVQRALVSVEETEAGEWDLGSLTSTFLLQSLLSIE